MFDVVTTPQACGLLTTAQLEQYFLDETVAADKLVLLGGRDFEWAAFFSGGADPVTTDESGRLDVGEFTRLSIVRPFVVRIRFAGIGTHV